MLILLRLTLSTRKKFLRLIQNEIENAERGKPASIFLKMNSLVDEEMIFALYKASNAGVKIRIIVRGICALIAGIEGMSQNIEVISKSIDKKKSMDTRPDDDPSMDVDDDIDTDTGTDTDIVTDTDTHDDDDDDDDDVDDDEANKMNGSLRLLLLSSLLSSS